MKKIIAKISLFFVSTVLTLSMLIFGVNFYLNSTQQLQSSYPTDWMLNFDFSFKHIFWTKPLCKYSRNCSKVADKKTDLPFEIFGHVDDLATCQKVVFVGDSFTINWTGITSYDSVVMNAYINERKGCAIAYKLAAGGSSTHQQFSRFLEVYEKLDPDIVIWQHYWNDVIENDRYPLFTLNKSGQLTRKNTFTNSTVWLGKLKSIYPKIAESKLYRHFFYVTISRDVTRYWNNSRPKFPNQHIPNEEVLTKIYQEMNALAQKNDFKLYTTLAPLECQFTPDECDMNEIQQESLRKLLTAHTQFVSMEHTKDPLTDSKVLGMSSDYTHLFRVKDEPDNAGWRHLTTEGNEYYGSILFQNLRNELFSD